jgi:hypothetical protein
MITSSLPSPHRITVIRREIEMTKFYSVFAAAALFAPFAMSMMNQAAQIMA